MSQIRELLKSQRLKRDRNKTRFSYSSLFKMITFILKHNITSLILPISLIFFVFFKNPTELKQENELYFFPQDILFSEEIFEAIKNFWSFKKNRAEIYTKHELTLLTQKILNTSSFSNITSFKASPDKIYLIAKKPDPVFKTKIGQFHFIASNGSIYGHADTSDIPVLYGVFSEDNENDQLIKDILTPLLQEKQKIIQTAIQLNDLLNDSNLKISDMSYEQFRGFSVTLKPSGTYVRFGIPPFSGKIKKLHTVLHDMKKQQRYAIRVELDYDGKAFVKSKDDE